MTVLDRATATAVTIAGLPTFATTNAYPLSRIRREVMFAIAQRTGELAAADAPLIDDWINDAYSQILGMIDNPRLTFSGTFTLPALASTIALPAVVDQVFALNSVIDGLITVVSKSVDIEYWRTLETNDELNYPLLNYYLHQDAAGLMIQFHRQDIPIVFTLDGTVRPTKLATDLACPALPEPLCLGMVDLAISIAMRRLGEYTYAGVQNNAALAIIRSFIDEKAKSRKGTVAAITRPRTLEEARRNVNVARLSAPYGS